MPVFEVTGPDGTKYRVTGPDGATKQDAIDQVRARLAGSSIENKSKTPPTQEDPGYALGTLQNVPESAINAAQGIYQTVRHPIQSVENIGSLGKGIAQKLGLSSGTDSIKYADAAWDYLKSRYGSASAIKKSFHDDPVGVILDASTVLGGAELTGIRGLSEAARVANPLNAVGKVAGPLASKVLGVTTGVGGESVSQAYQAGKAGGAASQAFTEQMRGSAPMEEVVTDAKAAVTKLRQERGAEYTQAMAKMGKQQYKILDFTDIDKAVDNTVKKYKGVSISPSVEKVQSEIKSIVDNWKTFAPAQYHTAEGLDALKQRIGDISSNLPYNTPQKTAADSVYNAIKSTIVKQAPEYADIMKGYSEASEQIREIEKTLSINPKANIDTSLRKITSSLRNNVNANFGRRKELVEFLQRSGAAHLLAKIAGQSLNSLEPRGLARLGAYGIGAESLMALANSNPAMAIKVASSLILNSPRLVGEAAHLTGKVSGPASQSALGLSRLANPEGATSESAP